MSSGAHSTGRAVRNRLGLAAIAWLAPYTASCAGAPPPAPPAPLLATASATQAAAPPPADPLGPRPETATAPPFIPPTPDVFGASGGMTVWLLERHQLPLVSCDLTVPTGASSDPKGKAGLTYVTANMLDEGAGARGAIDLARALDDLGARLNTDANADASFVSLTVLKHNLSPAFSIFADVVARPRFEPAEFRRVKDLWNNQLLQRAKDPDATARVVYRVALFGPDHPYGHPWDGTAKSAKAIALEDVKRAYAAAWRPDRATLVCVGDLTKQELTAMIGSSFASWKAPAAPAPPPIAPPEPKGPWPKLVLVDRPEAPQAVIAAVRPGPAASSPDEAALWRVNDAIGGSFMSRLNQDLREEHGYTYGARSRFAVSRGAGQVVSWANVVTDKTGEALSALVADLRKFADSGLNDEEIARTRSQARGELVGAYQSVERIAGHLGADASLGLPPDWGAKVAEKRDAAGK
ncbi:MAG TPA: pitrilysin family protein, partial [Polyangiaceae bacterium]|nr:pitrilysin family protein [Polyangiaceae bacterium]